jgi:hypothetical protein
VAEKNDSIGCNRPPYFPAFFFYNGIAIAVLVNAVSLSALVVLKEINWPRIEK